MRHLLASKPKHGRLTLETSFHERYASMSDDELLHIAGDRKDLLEVAAVELDAEMVRRGLTHKQARSRKRDYLRLDIEEARRHRKRKKSKYFVSQINLWAHFIGLAVPFLIVLILGHHRIPEEWAWPVFVVYLSALLAFLAVQPWVRQMLSFWFSLAISFVPQFAVAHWLAIYHPSRSASALKGAAFLSMFSGYLLGGGMFLLLQKLKPRQEAKTTN